VTSSTAAGATDRLDLSPFTVRETVTPSAFGIQLVITVTGAFARAVIYSCDADGWPDALLYESANLSTTAATASDSVTPRPELVAGVCYWQGVHFGAASSVRGHSFAYLPEISGVGTDIGTITLGSILRKVQTFASGAPDPYGSIAGLVLNAFNAPSIIMRA